MKIKSWLILALILLALFVSFFIGRKSITKHTDIVTQTDTLIVHDTTRITEFKNITSKITDTLCIVVVDTIHHHDTTYITLYKEVKVYEDSLFKAQISGIEPNLDWIEVFPQTTAITTVTTKYKPANWGIGVQVGAGIDLHGLATPYIGVGISYNLLSW